jgi:CRISPR type III-B/RAMP module-associated protein Cmr3
MPLYEVCIEPLEPLLFGDNRSARAGLDHLQRDQDPSPLTLHGAIGRYLADRSRENWPAGLLGEEQEDVLNPRSPIAELLGYCVHGAGGTLCFPRPRHLRCTLHKSEPRPVDLVTPGGKSGATASVSWQKLLLPAEDEPLDDEAEGELLLRESALERVLCGDLPPGGALHPYQLFRAEPRPGIAVDNGAGTVFEGAFFTRPYRRFQSSELAASAAWAPAGFAAWLMTLAPIRLDVADAIGFLGGDRRRARFELREIRPVALNDLCGEVAQAAGAEESGGWLLYLLTPMLQAGPVEVDGLQPIAAALGKPGFTSGWNVQGKHPRPLRALVPAGSVYFFEWNVPPGPARAELVRRLWLHPLRQEGAAAGFGRCLPGIWR